MILAPALLLVLQLLGLLVGSPEIQESETLNARQTVGFYALQRKDAQGHVQVLRQLSGSGCELWSVIRETELELRCRVDVRDVKATWAFESIGREWLGILHDGGRDLSFVSTATGDVHFTSHLQDAYRGYGSEVAMLPSRPGEEWLATLVFADRDADLIRCVRVAPDGLKPVWTKPLQGGDRREEVTAFAHREDDEDVLAVCIAGQLTRFELATGRPQWSVELSPTYGFKAKALTWVQGPDGNGKLFAGGAGSRVWILDPANGAVEHLIFDPSEAASSGSSRFGDWILDLGDGRALITSQWGQLWYVDLEGVAHLVEEPLTFPTMSIFNLVGLVSAVRIGEGRKVRFLMATERWPTQAGPSTIRILDPVTGAFVRTITDEDFPPS